MSRLLKLQGELREASAAVAQFEHAFAIEPASRSVAVMLKSFQKRQRALEEEFNSLAKQQRADLCRYRFFSELAPAPAAAIGAGLVDFQKMFSLALDAIKTGPKKRTRLTPELIQQSTFIFGYTFSGSVGVVLTFDNSNRDLFGSELDSAMEALRTLAMARTKEEVTASGRVLGVPCINAMYEWASHHLKAGLGADIEWQQGDETKLRMFLQLSDLHVLVDVIDKTDQTFDEEMELDAELIGADMGKRIFHLRLNDGSELLGGMAETIASTDRFEINSPHHCVLKKRVRVFYSTQEEEDVSYHLVSATRIKDESE